jgi:pimeloyl-ACP methyl ester carboxylesterase
MTGMVFVHSPLIGPLAWREVAGAFAAAGQPTAVPDFTGVLAGAPPYHPAIARAVAAALDSLGEPAVLVGHSGAGPLLPGIAAAAAAPVRALLYVDAGLPYPGRSWFETAPAELVAHLQGMATDGWLPPWHRWFPADALAELVPDPRLRDRFTAELSPLPLGYFHEPTAAETWSGPSGYLLLSEVYRDDAERAAAAGAPVRELPSHHLAMLTSPAAVTGALRDLVATVTAG